jgi:hypothetical protein
MKKITRIAKLQPAFRKERRIANFKLRPPLASFVGKFDRSVKKVAAGGGRN